MPKGEATRRTIRWFLMIGFGAAAAFLGFAQLFVYLLLNNVVYAVIVSMIVDSWATSGAVLIESNEENWIIYVHGIPVRESRSTLRNLLFESKDTMRRRYLALLVPKLLLALVCVYSLVKAILASDTGYGRFFAAGALLFLLYSVFQTTESMRTASSDAWLTAQHDVRSKTFHAAYVRYSDELCVPFLGCVLE
jgi:hypothetical protein